MESSPSSLPEMVRVDADSEFGVTVIMGLSKLSARCQACPFADACDKKEMEAFGFLPLPEQASKPTEAGYRNVENFRNNPKVLIGTDQSSGGLVRTSGEIGIEVEELDKVYDVLATLGESFKKGLLTGLEETAKENQNLK